MLAYLGRFGRQAASSIAVEFLGRALMAEQIHVIDISGAPQRETLGNWVAFACLMFFVLYLGGGVVAAAFAFIAGWDATTWGFIATAVFVAGAIIERVTRFWRRSSAIRLGTFGVSLAHAYGRLPALASSGAFSRRGRWWAALNLALSAYCLWSANLVLGSYRGYVGCSPAVCRSTADDVADLVVTAIFWRAALLFVAGLVLLLNARRLWLNRGGVSSSLTAVGLRLWWGLGTVLMVAAGPALIYGVSAAIYGVDFGFSGHFNLIPSFGASNWIALIVAYVAAFLLGRAGYNLSKPFRANLERQIASVDNPSHNEEQSRDRRAPTLYLRSFQDDGSDTEPYFENMIGAEARRMGPFVALGAPGSRPVRGASRAYYTATDWQPAVRRWIADCQIAVVVAHWTEGLAWELETLLQNGNEQKLVLLFPGGGDTGHKLRCSWARQRLKSYPFGPSLQQADLSQVLAMIIRPGGRLVIIKGKKTNELAAAFAAAAYGVLSAA
ncbi:MAG TPA: hypothetical protein DHW63_06070 [Hyphomonadaceae bacterium]|nr:hypothetical protein [Hyphomonadaceae bacterium]